MFALLMAHENNRNGRKYVASPLEKFSLVTSHKLPVNGDVTVLHRSKKKVMQTRDHFVSSAPVLYSM